MKALIKIGFVVALCVGAGSVYGQAPVKTGQPKKQFNKEPIVMSTEVTPAQKATPAPKAAPTKKARALVIAMPAKQAATKQEKVQ